MSFTKLPIGACGGLMGGRVAQLILKFPIGGDLTKISES